VMLNIETYWSHARPIFQVVLYYEVSCDITDIDQCTIMFTTFDHAVQFQNVILTVAQNNDVYVFFELYVSSKLYYITTKCGLNL